MEQASATDSQNLVSLQNMLVEKNAELNQLKDLIRAFCREAGEKI